MPQSQQAGDACFSHHEAIRLLEAVATGEQAALTAFYEKTSALVYSLALRILQEPLAAQDVTLEVYTQVWRSAAQYDVQRGTPLAWLYTITRTRALDRLRTRAQQQQREQSLALVSQVPDRQPGPAESSIINEAQRLVQNAMQGLPSEQREVIELAYYAGLSHRDIAARLAQPLGTVKTRIRLGMLHLRARLSPVIGD